MNIGEIRLSMGLEKIGVNISKELIAWTRTSGKSLLATRPVKVNIQGLKYVPQLEKDVVQLSKNDYLANIRKLALKDKDTKLLENLLADNESYTPLEQSILTELRQKFNQIVNRPDVNLDELRNLLSGKEVERGLFGKKIWRNDVLKNHLMCEVIFEKLKYMQPKDLEIIKRCNDSALESLLECGDFMLPDKYIKKLSGLLKKDDIYIVKTFSRDLDRSIIECYGKGNKTYFTYDPKKGALVSFEEDGTKKLIKERLFLKDKMGNPKQLIRYESSDVDGVFNVVQKDLKTGKEIPLSEAFVDSTGKKVVRQNLVSPKGTKSHIQYEEMHNGNTQYRYTIADKKGNTLLEQVRSREVLNNSEFVYKINDKSYNVKFAGSDKIEIINQQTKHLDTIDLKTLLSELSDNEKAEMLAMLKKVPADELLVLNKNGIIQILKGSIRSSSTFFESGSISTIPNEFVFLHELGHQKDMAKNIINAKDKELIRKAHKKKTDFIDDKYEPFHSGDIEYINGEWRLKHGKEPSQKEIEEGFKTWDIFDKLSKLSRKKIAQISTNKDLLKIYNKERAAYIKKFGSEDERINYFIRLGSGLGYQGEAVAEINALLSTPLSESMLGTRSYLLAENFPETIAHARNFLFT